MAKIIIDNQEVECSEGVPVLQAAINAGRDIPHYCYHPGLSVVASCRLCLMETKMPHPKTQEMVWAPKLIPSCQTPVRDGMEVRFDSDAVKKSQENCMEFFLLNHPLDCPVCDQAGECYLQDYSYKFGKAESRMVDEKWVNPKKDIGPNTLLYQDRCVMCTRCVRFTREVTGTAELCVVNRGSKDEIDVFPGRPLDNAMQGNVVDICPVGCLLDKDFLFKRRVWELKGVPSICPGCSTGCSIRVDQADEKVYRLKPRYNPKVNDWWMCDEGRYGYKYAHDPARLTRPVVRRGLDETHPNWADMVDIVQAKFAEQVRESGAKKVAAVLSPFMACEEAWLLIRFIREVAPESTLVLGPVPIDGDDQCFPVGTSASDNNGAKFTIRSEKCPNRNGVQKLLDGAGGASLSFDAFVEQVGKGEFSAAWIVGGYPKPWVEKPLAKAIEKFELLVAQDMFTNEVVDAATVVLPACPWVERDGSFVNATGLAQPFERAIAPLDGAMRDGQYLFEIAGFDGLYSGERVRELMSSESATVHELYEAPKKPAHAH